MWTRALAVLGGAALLGSLFLSWYALDVGEGWTFYVGSDEQAPWATFTVTDVALATLAFATPVIAFRRPAVAPAFGVAAVALVGFRLIEPPGPDIEYTLAPGAGLAVAGALALCAPWLRFVAPVLLLAALWMPWFGHAPTPEAGNLAEPMLAGELGGGPGEPWYAWDPYTLSAIAIGVLALVSLRRRWAALPAALLVAAWIAFPPDGLEPRTGAFIALAAAILAAFVPRPEPDA